QRQAQSIDGKERRDCYASGKESTSDSKGSPVQDKRVDRSSTFLATGTRVSKKNRVRRRKVKQIPVKADIEAQETFKTEVLEPLVEQAQAGKIHLFFVDAAHFV
ncbi:hypothetical protein RZS08_55815, partial [Arthrospira platensis SPKY1]|nr:hypothetical protein [Arthrospira platensis SPKY1]